MGLKPLTGRVAAWLFVAASPALVLPHPAAAATAWPGESWSVSTNLTSLNPTGWAKNLSGAYWNPATRRLWVCTNSPAKFWSLREDGAGSFLVEREYTGSGDLEAITQTSAAPDRVFLLDEQARTIRSYRVSDGAALTTWLLTSIPDWGNSGPEGLAFVPDTWLARNAFVDGSGASYPQSVQGANGFGGLVFVAVQTSGWVYAFDLRTDGTFAFVGRYLTSRNESCEMTFDESIGKMYILHNIDGNLLQVTNLTSTVSGSDRRFNTAAEFQVPSGSNIEGFALTPALTATNAIGDDWCFFTDDDNAVGALRWFKQLHSRMDKHAGDGQTAETGSAVAVPPSALVADPFLNPLPGFSVAYSATTGGGSVTGADAVTDAGGVATVGAWILGATPGANTLTASGASLTGSPLTFTATGVDHAAPTASIVAVAPDPRSAAVDSIRIVFSEPVVNFDLADLQLTRDGGPDLLTGAEALTTPDRIGWTLGTSALTAAEGTYQLTLSPSNITDDAGNPLASGASDSWFVQLPASVEPNGQGPAAVALGTPVPNPSRGDLRIPFSVPRETQATLTVFDVRGRRVRSVTQGTIERGAHWAVWDGRCDDGSPARSGVYFYRLTACGTVLGRRGFLVR